MPRRQRPKPDAAVKGQPTKVHRPVDIEGMFNVRVQALIASGKVNGMERCFSLQEPGQHTVRGGRA